MRHLGWSSMLWCVCEMVEPLKSARYRGWRSCLTWKKLHDLLHGCNVWTSYVLARSLGHIKQFFDILHVSNGHAFIEEIYIVARCTQPQLMNEIRSLAF